MDEYTIDMRVHLPLLIRQKQALLRAIERNPKDIELLDGILNLLDHIHDTIDPPEALADFIKRNPDAFDPV